MTRKKQQKSVAARKNALTELGWQAAVVAMAVGYVEFIREDAK